ncbi:MAG: addiction module protein [Bacteroidetes bacterium]|nr:addiction module protein [Bacteroidota bacterium]
MTKTQLAELHKLSVKDKINLVQTLWEDIAKEQSLTDLPVAHKKILDARLQKIYSGEAEFKSWGEVQAKYGKLK